MTPEEITKLVTKESKDDQLTESEVLALVRYFLSLHCVWLTAEAIGEMHFVTKGAVYTSIEKVKTENRFRFVRDRIERHILYDNQRSQCSSS